MVYYEQIDRLKQQLTDKFVVVDESRPELRRFAGQTGVVKTVNMSGRALVQFDAYNNIGWYDIDPTCLKIVDAPPAQPEAKKDKSAPTKVDKPAAAKTEKPTAAAKPAAAPKAGGSVADILAAARGGAKSAPAKPAEAVATKEAAPAPAAKPGAANPKAMSVADILAAARGKTSPAPAAAQPKAEVAKPAAAPPKPVAPPPVEATVEETPVAAPPAAAAPAGGKLSKRDQYPAMADMVAYCRTADAK